MGRRAAVVPEPASIATVSPASTADTPTTARPLRPFSPGAPATEGPNGLLCGATDVVWGLAVVVGSSLWALAFGWAMLGLINRLTPAHTTEAQEHTLHATPHGEVAYE